MQRERSFEQPRLEVPRVDAKNGQPIFVSSRGEVVSAADVQAACQGCQLGRGDAQCLICSTVSQADFTKAGKCVWKREQA